LSTAALISCTVANSKVPREREDEMLLLESGRGNSRPIYTQGRLGKMIFGLND